MKTSEPKSLNLKSLEIGHTESSKIFLFLFPDEEKKFLQCNYLDTINCLRKGLPKSAINALIESEFVTMPLLSNLLHISSRQLKRYDSSDLLPPEQSGFLYELTRLYVRATAIFGDTQTTNNWINRPNMALGEIAPIEILDTVEGYRKVDDLLSQIEYGFYS